MIACPIQIRFADVDMAGHVHNAAYLHYFETARLNFFISTLGNNWDWKSKGFILKKNTIEYHQPILLTDEITVEINCISIGNKSFTLSYHVYNKQKQEMCYGESVIVCIDYTINQTILIPDNIKLILEKHFIKK